MHNVGKWSNVIEKFCGVHTATVLKYACAVFNTMHEKVTFGSNS